MSMGLYGRLLIQQVITLYPIAITVNRQGAGLITLGQQDQINLVVARLR